MAGLASRLANTRQKSSGMSDVDTSIHFVEQGIPRPAETPRKQPIAKIVGSWARNLLSANPLVEIGIGVALASAVWLVVTPLLPQFANTESTSQVWEDFAGVDWQVYGPAVGEQASADDASSSSGRVKSCPEVAREVAGYARGLGVSEEAVTGLCAMLDHESLPSNKVDTVLVGVLNNYDELLSQAGKAELEDPGGRVHLTAMTESFETGKVEEVKKSLFDWAQLGETTGNPSQVIAILAKAAQILQNAGRFGESAEIYERAHQLAADDLGETHPTAQRLKSLQTWTQLSEELEKGERRETTPKPFE